MALLAGANGAGKSTVFGCLELLRLFITGEQKTDALFLENDLTRWAGENVQKFELEVKGNGGTYTYRLTVAVDKGKDRSRVVEETLHMDGKPLFEMRLSKTDVNASSFQAQLYRDDFTAGPQYPFDWTQSGIGFLLSRSENSRLTWFRDYISRLLVVKINPFAMESESDGEAERPSFNMSNFSSWYRYISQEQQGKLMPLFESLKNALDGFQSLNLPKTGEKRRALRATFGTPQNGKPVEFGLNELSEGQRVLLALYTIMDFCMAAGGTVCIDEPDNFIAIREIQPWLSLLKERCLDGNGQALLISHHPEIVDYLPNSMFYWMSRSPVTPARIRTLDGNEGTLQLSELMARGWLHE